MTIKIKGWDGEVTERKTTKILCWYDPHLRLWTLTPQDDEGNQTDMSKYAYGKKNALTLKSEMERGL